VPLKFHKSFFRLTARSAFYTIKIPGAGDVKTALTPAGVIGGYFLWKLNQKGRQCFSSRPSFVLGMRIFKKLPAHNSAEFMRRFYIKIKALQLDYQFFVKER